MGRVGIPDVTVQVPAHEHVRANGSKMDPFALDYKMDLLHVVREF
jgi:hypothetical protein